MTEKRERYIPWHIEDKIAKLNARKEKNIKRGKSSKRKGKRREKECGDYVTKLIGGEAIVRHGNRDVQFVGNGLEHHHIEVKGRKAFAFIQHCKQAEQDAATHGLPRWLVWAKADREVPYVITDARDYCEDMAELKERREHADAEG